MLAEPVGKNPHLLGQECAQIYVVLVARNVYYDYQIYVPVWTVEPEAALYPGVRSVLLESMDLSLFLRFY